MACRSLVMQKCGFKLQKSLCMSGVCSLVYALQLQSARIIDALCYLCSRISCSKEGRRKTAAFGEGAKLLWRDAPRNMSEAGLAKGSSRRLAEDPQRASWLVGPSLDCGDFLLELDFSNNSFTTESLLLITSSGCMLIERWQADESDRMFNCCGEPSSIPY
jgi:hypothetical protein